MNYFSTLPSTQHLALKPMCTKLEIAENVANKSWSHELYCVHCLSRILLYVRLYGSDYVLYTIESSELCVQEHMWYGYE